MKKRTKIILLVTGIMVLLCVVIVIAMVIIDKVHISRRIKELQYPEKIEMNELITTSYEEIYSEKWEFGGAIIYDEEHSPMFSTTYDERCVDIYFNLKEGSFDDNMLENISEIYKAVASTIEECLEEKYDLYPISINFMKPNSGKYISIICMDNNKTVKMKCRSEGLSLKEIVRVFPEINELENNMDVNGYNCFQYDGIEEIVGFKDLRVLDFQLKLPEEDKEYILSIYPDCEIVEEPFYEYKMEEY